MLLSPFAFDAFGMIDAVVDVLAIYAL